MIPSGNVVSVVRASHPVILLGGHLVCIPTCNHGFSFVFGYCLSVRDNQMTPATHLCGVFVT